MWGRTGTGSEQGEGEVKGEKMAPASVCFGVKWFWRELLQGLQRKQKHLGCTQALPQERSRNKTWGLFGASEEECCLFLPCCLFAFCIASQENFIHSLWLMVVFFFFFFVAFLLFTIDLTEASLVDSHQSSYGGSVSTEPAGPFITLAV